MRIDHIVLAAPSLDAACQEIARQTGVTPAYGGRHGHGLSHNAVIALGPRRYLEIFAPTTSDPQGDDWAEQAARLPEPRLFGYCIDAGAALDDLVIRAASLGIAGAGPTVSSRTLPDGETLTWRLFEPAPGKLGAVPPIFIDWGASRHPSEDAPAGTTLAAMTVTSPAADLLSALIGQSVPDLRILTGGHAALRVDLLTSGGPVTLHG